MHRPINKNALQKKNQQYLESLRQGTPSLNVMCEILGATFDSSADAIIVFDASKRIVLANTAAAIISGWDLEDVSRDQLRERFQFYSNELSREPLPVEEEPLEVALATKQNCLKEAFVRGASLRGAGRWVRANAAPVLDQNGEISGAVTVFQDITEEVHARSQRDRLMSLITHDLKNHLAAEKMMLSLLLERLTNDSDVKLRKLADSMRNSNEQFLLITESMLELSRSEFFQGNEFAKPVAIGDSLAKSIAANEDAATVKQVELKLSIDPELPQAFGLPGTINQVFTNIILNAIQASFAGGLVEIKASSSSSGRLQVLVTDHGIGMTNDQLSSLFEPLRVARHSRSTTNSTGFGLFLASMLVQSQNGTIYGQSNPDGGTTIGVEIPLVQAGSISAG